MWSGTARRFNFNPRSREGSDKERLVESEAEANISIHAPAKGATQLRHLFFGILVFQSTLPRRERHAQALRVPSLYPISIHAPAKGATEAYTKLRRYDNISIHAPAKGATDIYRWRNIHR